MMMFCRESSIEQRFLLQDMLGKGLSRHVCDSYFVEKTGR